jgi:hypothetical protein
MSIILSKILAVRSDRVVELEAEIENLEDKNNKLRLWQNLNLAESDQEFNRILLRLFGCYDTPQECIDEETNQTPLHIAAKNNYLESLFRLISKFKDDSNYLLTQDKRHRMNFCQKLEKKKEFYTQLKDTDLLEDISVNARHTIKEILSDRTANVSPSTNKSFFALLLNTDTLPEWGNLLGELFRVLSQSYMTLTPKSDTPYTFNFLSGVAIGAANGYMCYSENMFNSDEYKTMEH